MCIFFCLLILFSRSGSGRARARARFVLSAEAGAWFEICRHCLDAPDRVRGDDDLKYVRARERERERHLRLHSPGSVFGG